MSPVRPADAQIRCGGWRVALPLWLPGPAAGMKLCALCGQEPTPADAELCSHHTYADPEWAAVNATAGAFFHRDIVPPPVAEVMVDPAIDPMAWVP